MKSLEKRENKNKRKSKTVILFSFQQILFIINKKNETIYQKMGMRKERMIYISKKSWIRAYKVTEINYDTKILLTSLKFYKKK